MRASDIPAADRIRAKLVPQSNGCMYWTGFIDPCGYGRLGYRGRRSTPLQRAVYDCFVGPIPDGMVIDHLCHTDDTSCPGGNTCMHRRCGNPAHLGLKTAVGNVLAGRSFSAVNATKTHCPQGHPYTESNTYVTAGRRYCVTCYIAAHDGRPPAKRYLEMAHVD